MTRVLAVSYDETLLRTRQLVLESAGYKTQTAVALRSALKKIGEHPTDALILCHSIQRDDKQQLIAEFRKRNPKAIVIALSRAGEKNVQNVDGYVSPADPEELIRSVARLIGPPPRRPPHTVATAWSISDCEIREKERR